jgi:hypothetical protein
VLFNYQREAEGGEAQVLLTILVEKKESEESVKDG